MKLLSLITFLFSSACFASASDKCIELCRNGSPDCISLGLVMKQATQPLLDFIKSAQAKSDGVVGSICNRDTILAGEQISNSGPICSFSYKLAQNSNTVTEVPGLVQGQRKKTSSGVFEVVFDLAHTFKSATYDENGSLVLGGEVASIVPFIESDGTSTVIWETTSDLCYSQIDKFR